MGFTEPEKVKIRHHLGYLGVAQSQTFVLGVPAAVETQFIIEGAMDKVLLASEPEARRQLQILDSLEEQMLGDMELLAVDVVGEITIRKTEHKELWKQYDIWRRALANLLGVMPNPFDQRFLAMGGVNVPVIH